MRVHVTIECGEISNQFTVHCGDGSKTIKWLAMTASERFSSGAPRGAQRCRERKKIPIHGSHYLPSNVRTETQNSLRPDLRIQNVLEDDEEIVVELAPKVAVCALGNPELSDWAILAFARTEQQRNVHFRAREIQVAVDEEARREQEQNEKKQNCSKISEKASLMKKILAKQIPDEEQKRNEMQAEWTKIINQGLLDRITDDEDEVIRLQQVIESNFYPLSALFKHFCALGSGDATNTLEYLEFTAFVEDLGIFKGKPSTEMLRKIFTESLERAPKVLLNELHRHEFFVALIRLSHARSKEKGTVNLSHHPLDYFLERLIQERIMLFVDHNLHLAAIISAFSSNDILALFYDHNLKLIEVFEKYSKSVQDIEGTNIGIILEDTLNISEFKRLLDDAGFLGWDKQSHNDMITAKSLRQIFSTAQSGVAAQHKYREGDLEILFDDDKQMDYPEFLEAIARVALLKFQHEALPTYKKLKSVLEQICALV